MTAGEDGTVYELHFDEPIGDPENPRGQAQHYIGHSADLDSRVAEHRRGNTAAIMRAVREAGIGWRVVRTWPGTRDTERAIKDLKSGRRLCPECTEHPLTGAGAIARAAAVRQERAAQAARSQVQAERLEAQLARGAQEREAAREAAKADPYGDGQRMARQWLAQQDAAGRTAAQIEATHGYVTGPWRETAHRTPAEAERFRGYTQHVSAALAEFRADEAQTSAEQGGPAGGASSKQEEAEMSDETDTWLARDGDGRVLEVDAAGHPGAEASPDDGRPVVEAAAEAHAAELADPRVRHAAHFENDGRSRDRAVAVADRGRWAQRQARQDQFERDATAARELRLSDEAQAEAEAG